MKFRWIVMVVAGLAVVAADPAFARVQHNAKRPCVDRPIGFSWDSFFFSNKPTPGPNGCAPPVFSNGRFVGQDPDVNIRFQLNRDPSTGYRFLY
jgi:hypothetical protein